VAFQGERGAFGEVAIAQHWGGRAAPVPQLAFAGVVDAVARGDVHAGVLPVENSIVGDIAPSVAALAACPELKIVAQTVVAIDLVLMAVPGVPLLQIQWVSAHPVALAQCAAWLGRHARITSVPAYDSAGAASMLAEHRDRRAGVIAGRRVAALYGLRVLVDQVADREDNATRFVVIARGSATLAAGVNSSPVRQRGGRGGQGG
jgi:prephenate dehydratase